jgi:hypothetical protein
MKKLICLAAISAPLLVSCSSKEEGAATDQPARITDVSPDTVMSGERKFTAEHMQANRDALDAFVASRVTEANIAATSWADVLDRDWPIKYLHCKEADGTRVDDSKCHLYVDETKTPPAPVRNLRIGKISDTEYWAIVRTEKDANGQGTNEFMYCGSLTQKDPGTPSYISGECTIWPHDTVNPVHWVDMNVRKSSLGTFTSIFFEFSDNKPNSPTGPVHNGDAHGGDD